MVKDYVISPCPICGKTDELSLGYRKVEPFVTDKLSLPYMECASLTFNGNTAIYKLCCSRCNLSHENVGTEAEIIEKWNRRAEIPPPKYEDIDNE